MTQLSLWPALVVVEAMWPRGHHRHGLAPGWYRYGGGEPVEFSFGLVLVASIRYQGGRARVVRV